jgi:hypothetical protein
LDTHRQALTYALLLCSWSKAIDPPAPPISGRSRRQKHGGTRLTFTRHGNLQKRARNKARRQAIRRSRAG